MNTFALLALIFSSSLSAQDTALSKIVAIQQTEINRLKSQLAEQIKDVPGDHSCAAIKLKNPAAKDGVYTIIHGDGSQRYPAYCDMTTQGGGWTLVDTIGSIGESIAERKLLDSNHSPNPSTTAGRYLPFYYWTSDPQLLCKSSQYTGSKDWLTLKASSDLAKEYPTKTTAVTSYEGGWTAAELNGNTFRGLTSWIYKADGRTGTVWIGNGSQPTCTCGYYGEAASTGLGTYISPRKATCSTWVR